MTKNSPTFQIVFVVVFVVVVVVVLFFFFRFMSFLVLV